MSTPIKTAITNHLTNNQELLEKIASKLETYQNIDNPHYGHVGDLNKIKSDLEDILIY